MENEIVLFETVDHEVKLHVPVENNTVWLNRKQLAELFGRDVKTIGKHINNSTIFHSRRAQYSQCTKLIIILRKISLNKTHIT